MKKEIVVKDYGKITIAERWEDVTLAQFTELMRRQNNDESTPITIMDVLEIFTGKEKDYLNQLPADFIESLIARLVFLHENPKADKASNTIVIDGEEYYVNYMEKLKFGEFTDVNQIIKDDHLNYAAILAILCRKKGEVYDCSKYLLYRYKWFRKKVCTGNARQWYSKETQRRTGEYKI